MPSIAIPLSLRGQLLSGSRFEPSRLFAANEPGVWYDPSDLSTMFQDTAGTVPVTAAGQSVAMVLDKSKGLVLGPELVTNGGFSSGVTGWSDVAGKSTIAVVSGELEVTATASFGAAATQVLTGLTIGRTYSVSALLRAAAGNSGAKSARVCILDPGTAYVSQHEVSANGVPRSLSFVFVATKTTLTVALEVASVSAWGAVGDKAYFDNISVKELPGNHATQTTAGARPTYQVDATGRGFLLFDGADDWLVTPTITPGTDKAQVFAGVRKLSDAVRGVLIEHSADINANNGTFTFEAPDANAVATYRVSSKGTAIATVSASGFVSPITSVVSMLNDVSGDTTTLRVNGAQAAQSVTDQGTGNYLAYPLYIGRRGGTTLPFNGRIYGLIVRFGANLTADQIARVETWMNGKTGAY